MRKTGVRSAVLSSVLAAMIAVAALAPTAGARRGPVLVVGDSLEVGAGPHLRRELSPVPVTIDARTGRPSSEGVAVVRKRLRPNHQAVVFDLGTNDDPSRTAALGRNLATVRDLAGNRCLVVSTLRRPPLNGVGVDGMNSAVRDFASATPRTWLLDWAGAVRANSALLAKDGVHATPAGYAERGRLVAATVEECFARDAPAQSERGSGEAAADEPPRPRLRTVSSGGSVARLLGLTPYDTIAGYVRGAFDIVLAASREVSGAVSPRPPEVKLGAEPG